MKQTLATIFVLLFSFHFCTAQITAENDSLFSKQKDLFEMLGVFKAWETTQGDPSVLIGCVDNGFDFYHPYLYEQLIPGYYVDKAYHPMTFTTIAHGTLVSSLMVAKPKNENGMHGLAPDCKVLTASIGSIEHIFRHRQQNIRQDTIAMREFADKWTAYAGAAMAKSITYLVENDVKLINISAEIISIYPKEIQQKIDAALEQARERDVLVVIAAGNGNKEIPDALKHWDNIIMVGASTKEDTRWTMTAGGITQGSNWGKLLDVCAPTEGLVVCMPSDNRFYKTDDGPMGAENIPNKSGICNIMPYGATSSAAPIVTSLAALVYSIAPDLTAKEVKRVIAEGCDDIEEKGFDVYTGHGRINFGKTIELAKKR